MIDINLLEELAAERLKNAELIILLREARNALNAMFLLLAKSDKAEEAFAKFGHLGTEINKYAKDETAYSGRERRA